ncbi:MAG: hypothetical protein GTO00_09395, partial [Deltaproteobacteria bacterium]|nr:hypothetical protein [Deltaproteobacteria bacterium]
MGIGSGLKRVCSVAVLIFLFAASSEAGIVGSPHDFSASGPMTQSINIAPSGPCSGCHDTHGALDGYVLWSRDLSDEISTLDTDGSGGNPNYVQTPTVQCYDCHDDHSTTIDDDPAENWFTTGSRPQDIAFGMTGSPGNWTPDGVGNVAGYYENDPPNSTNLGVYTDILTNSPDTRTGGHFFKSADPATGSAFDQYDKLPCRDCHDPHNWDNSNNQAFIREQLTGSGTKDFPTIVRASPNMYNTPTGVTRNAGDSREICITCHGIWDSNSQVGGVFTSMAAGKPTVSFNEISSAYTNTNTILSPANNVAQHGDADTNSCTDCHSHNSISASCDKCHAFPPATNAHDKHVNTVGL